MPKRNHMKPKLPGKKARHHPFGCPINRVVSDPQIYDLRYSSRSFWQWLEIQSFTNPCQEDWRYSTNPDHDHIINPASRIFWHGFFDVQHNASLYYISIEKVIFQLNTKKSHPYQAILYSISEPCVQMAWLDLWYHAWIGNPILSPIIWKMFGDPNHRSKMAGSYGSADTISPILPNPVDICLKITEMLEHSHMRAHFRTKDICTKNNFI